MASATGQVETIDKATAEALKPAIHLLIVTATEVESEAVWERMQPLPGRAHIIRAFLGNQTYRIGTFGLWSGSWPTGVERTRRFTHYDSRGVGNVGTRSRHNARDRVWTKSEEAVSL